jgi:hypothetical protein
MRAKSILLVKAFFSLAIVSTLAVQSVDAQSGSSICARSPEQGSCPTLPLCPTPIPPPKVNCPEDGLCKISSCPEGSYLWEPTKSTCECVTSEVACSQLADIARVGTRRYHYNSTPPETMDSFVNWVGATGAEVLADSSRLNALSPCVEKARDRCTAMVNSQTLAVNASGFISYRTSSSFDFLDTCIASALQVMTGNSDMGWLSGNDKSAYIEWGTTGFVYNDCSAVEEWKRDLLSGGKLNNCGRGELVFRELTSPVSLLWNQEIKIEDVVSRSKFPLNPKEAGKWFVWHASGHTPLVVWDPEHKGTISAANQLFGSHTWDKEWKSGYEALATLDVNKSGWLEGAEVAKLALWFDFNQDGISDTGEVKTLESLGVTALGVKPSHEDPKSHHIFAKEGFRRNVNGKEITGGSVDWFTGSTDERLGLEARYPNLQQATLPVSSQATTGAAAGDFAGVWDWRAVDRTGEELPENLPSGSLILYGSGSGIAGSAYSVSQYAPNASGIAERVVRTRLSGKTEDVKGEGQLLVTASTEYGGTVKTVARLSADKKHLFGMTTEEVGPKKEKVEYQWIAIRYKGT